MTLADQAKETVVPILTGVIRPLCVVDGDLVHIPHGRRKAGRNGHFLDALKYCFGIFKQVHGITIEIDFYIM